MTEYVMRPLKTSDIFKMSKILKKLEVKLEVNKEVTQQEMGVQMLQKVAENLHLAEDEVNIFMADLVGFDDPREFALLPIEDTFKIIGLFKEQKGIGSFLSAVKA